MRDLVRDRPFVRNAAPVVLLCCLAQACVITDPGEQPPDAGPAPQPDARPAPPPDAQVPLPDAQPPPPPPPPPEPPSSFLSADEPEVALGEEEEEEEEEEAAEEELAAGRAGESAASADTGRADIYAVLGDGKILELNEHRGLQIIDVADPERPVRMGHLPIIGEPRELHVSGDLAIVVINHRQRFEPTGEGLGTHAYSNAGSVMLVDLTDRDAPRLVSEVMLTGAATTSRLLTRGGLPTLYVAFNEDDWFRQPDGSYENRRGGVVQSFQLVAGALVERSRLAFVGFVGVVHVAGDVLLVNHRRFADNIALIDIGAADGSMVQRGQVMTNERVRSVDLRNGLLYAFSGPTAIDGPRCELFVWDVTNLAAPVLVDPELISQFRMLHATALLGDRAFAITHDYDEQGATLHALAIDAAGEVTIVGERDVASWSSFFHPVLGDTRLLGIGPDVSMGFERLALTLYDATDPAHPEPLLATALVTPAPGPSSDGSLAMREQQALTVLEDAVNVQAPTGELETGLVLVPFQASWDDNGYQSASGVQMFTFSSKTLTRRGTMAHAGEPARSFLLGDGLVAMLSSRLLGLFTSDLAAPGERANIELVDSFVQLLPLGDYRIRVRSVQGYDTIEVPDQRYVVEIIPRDAPADSAEPVSSFEVPYEAQVFLMGDILVTVTDRGRYTSENEIVIETHDLSDPRAPRKLAELVSSELPPFGGPNWRFDSPRRLHVLADKLVFTRRVHHYASEVETGIAHETTVQQSVNCGGQVGCAYLTGAQLCFDLDSTSYCEGGFAQCTYLGHGRSECTPKAAAELGDAVWSHSMDATVSRPWQQLTLHSVDLSDPAQPTLGTKIIMPEGESVVGIVADANQLYVTLKMPATASGDPRPHARTFLRRIDFADADQPFVSEPIDVPGEVIAVQGAALFTRHPFWGAHFIETAIAQLVLTGDEVRLLAYHRFTERSITDLRVGPGGLIVAKHDQVWTRPWGTAPGSFDHVLSLLRPPTPPTGGQPVLQGFEALSENPLAVAPSLDDVIPGRLFLRGFGGRLMVDISNPVYPVLRAFLPIDQVSGEILYQDGKMLVPAGPHGIIEHDLDATGLP
jgi:hypothetical protein